MSANPQPPRRSHPPSHRPKRPASPKRPRDLPPRYSQSDYTHALSLSTRPDKRPARAAFRAATLSNPHDPRLWLAWARMEAKLERWQPARDIFKEALDNHPLNVHLLHACAVMEDRAGHLDDARHLFRRCLELDPRDGVVWQSFALAEERAGRTDVARSLFEEGVMVDGARNPSLWSAWGVLEHRHGCYERACELFQRAVEIDENHARSLQAWAIALEKLARMKESEELFERALKADGGAAPTWQAYGLFQARRGNLERARELFTRGIQVNPDHAPIWHAWAIMEQKEGNFETARALFDKGVAAAPNSTPMLRAWASMELELGHIDKSLDWMVPREGLKGANKAQTKESVVKSKPRPRASRRQISAVGENLRMLRLMIERKSDEDVNTVMQWLDSRARNDRKLYDALAERRDKDSKKVKEWVERRSGSDIKAFKEWVEERYKKDARIGVYVFNWHIPSTMPTASVPVPARVPKQSRKTEKPVEWMLLSERPTRALEAFDESIYSQEYPTDYADGVYFLGQIAENLADRAALLLVLGAMTLGLIGVSAHLMERGYSPSGPTTQTTEESLPMSSPPNGVDAYLYEEGGAEAMTNLSRLLARPAPR